MKRPIQLLSALVCLALCGASAHAANKYWDINGATPGAGGPTPSGTWSTSAANWSTDSTGSAATAVWSGTTDTAIFSAGTDATGTYVITVPTALTCAGITIEEGTVQKASGGASITVGTGTITVSNGCTFSIDGSSAITASSGSTMSLNGSTIENRTTGSAGSFLPVAMKITVGTNGGILSYPTANVLNILQTGSPGTVISGTGGITKIGAGVLAVATACTYSGSTIVNEGELRIRTSANRLPIATAVIVNSPGILNLNTVGQQIGSLAGDGSVGLAGATLTINGSASTTYSGAIQVTANAGASPSTTLFGSVTKAGTGTLTLSGPNSYTGALTLSAGGITVTPTGSLCDPLCDVVVNGGTLTLNNSGQTVENLSGTGGTINLGPGHTLTSFPAGSTTYSGSITGPGALSYAGGNFRLTLSGTNSYNGGTTLNGGTLVVSGNNSGTGATTVNAGLLVGVVGGSMSGSVVTISGGGNVVAVTNNTNQWTCAGLAYNGGTTLDFDFRAIPAPSTTLAPLKVNGNVDFSLGAPTVGVELNNLPTGSTNYPLITWTGTLSGTPPSAVFLGSQVQAGLFISGKTLYLGITNNAEPLTWATNSKVWDTTSINWVNAIGTPVAYQENGGLPGDWAVFEDTKSGTPLPITVTINSTVNPYSVVVSNNSKDYIFSGPAGIGGGSGGTLAQALVVKRGSGKLTMTTVNSYAAPTVVEQGTLQLGNGPVIGDVQGVITNSATLVFSNATDQTHSADIRGAGLFIKGSAGTLTLGASGGNSMSGGQSVYDGTLLLNNTANTMAGPMTVNGPNAKLEIASSGCIGSTAASSGDITLDNAAIFENDNLAVGNTWLTANRKIIIGANGARFDTAPGSDPGNVVLLCTGTIAGSPVGVGTLTFDGPGELRYSGANAHNTFGKLILNGGRFTAGQATTAGFDDTYGAVPAVLTPNAITIQNGAQMRWGGSATDTLNTNRGITMGNGGGAISVVPGAALTIPGPITGSGPLRLHLIFSTSSDNGFLVLSGNNTFSGGVTIQSGTNCINSATALGAASSTVTIGANSSYAPQLRNTSAGAITLVNNNPQIWQTDFGFQGTQNLNLGTGAVTLSPLSGSTITMTGTANTLTVGGVISGSGMGLTKAGAGTLQLNAINVYTGDTTITAGTLQLGDSTANNGNVAGNIVDNATLVFANPTALTYSAGIISGTGALTKQGAGTLTLSGGPETYSGVTTISAGALRLGNNDVLSDASPVVLSGSTLDMNNFKDTIGPLSGPGNIINNSTTLTVTGDADPTGETVGGISQNYSCVYAAITNGALVKDGTHTMALRETNGLAVPITLKNGTLSAGVISNEMLTATAMDIPTGATFQLDAINQTLASLSGAGNLNLGGGTLTVNQTNSTTFSGVVQDWDVTGSYAAAGHGLRGYYYNNIDFTAPIAMRNDTNVNFTDLTSASQLPAAIYPLTNNLSIRWLGQIQSTAAGTYTFSVTSDDGSRLWVNGNLVIDSWIPQGATARIGTITLAANTRYDVVLEFFNRTGSSSCSLGWKPPGDSTTNAIPTDYLFLPGAGKLVKTGSGTLTLTGTPNTYSGGTEVRAGTLEASSLGTGSVSVSNGATLTLSAPTAMASTADLILSGSSPLVILFLNGGIANVRGLSYDGGVTWQPAGLYGAIGSGATYTDSRFLAPGRSGFLQVGAGPVSTQTLVSSLNPATYGNSITFTSTVTAATTPTGTVTFYDGASAIGTAALDGSGVATLTVNRLSVAGSVHSITAVYSGDANYVRSTSSAVPQTITPASVVPSVTVSNKVYDGTTSAAIASLSLAGVVSGDEPYVTLTGGTAAFSDKNVGTNKTVNVTGLSLTGSLAPNYVLSSTSASTNGNITNRPLTVTAVTSTKVYDGTTNSTGVPTITSGSLATGDTATWTQTFDSPEVGTRTLTPAGTVNDGNSGRNYTVTFVTASGSITPVCSATNVLLGITANPNSTFTLAFKGTSHAQYYVKTSTNASAPMTNWVAVLGSTNVVTNSSGLWSFTVTNITNASFYRSTAMSVCP